MDANVSSARSVSEVLAEFFMASDTDQNGYLELTELKGALQELSSCASLSDSGIV